MKKHFLTSIFIITVSITFLIVSFTLKTCSTAEKMADQTIFNADKHIWSYEEFRNKYQSFIQYKNQYKQVRNELAKLELKGITKNQRYDNLIMELSGIRNMLYRISAEYNKMASTAYQKIWKGDLPERLEPNLEVD